MSLDIFKKLKELNFPLGQYVVVGGALAAHNIREEHDLDILVTPVLYKKLLAEGYKQCKCEECLATSRLFLKKEQVDILPSFMFGNYVGDTKALIQSADIINGYPFIKLSEYIKFKRELGAARFLEDVELMEAYLVSVKQKSQEQLLEKSKIAKNQIGIGEFYAHFKHPNVKEYQIVDIGIYENIEEICVVYKSLKTGISWVRTLAEFLEEVEVDGKMVKRFTKQLT